MDYKSAGVDVDAGNDTVRRVRALARSTFTAGVLSDIGSFGGLFRFETGRFRDPVLVASAAGVGTKLKVAFLTGRHDTVGADLVVPRIIESSTSTTRLPSMMLRTGFSLTLTPK